MRPEQWETFKRAARLEKLDKIPMAMIIDSPWIPGYLGIKHMDYYLDPELWFQSNLKIMQEFPDIIFVPSWWMEYGMAAEPSVLGREDQVLAGQHAQRIPHALSPGRHRRVSRIRSRGRRLRRADAASHTRCTSSASSTTATSCRWSPRAARCARPASSAARPT